MIGVVLWGIGYDLFLEGEVLVCLFGCWLGDYRGSMWKVWVSVWLVLVGRVMIFGLVLVVFRYI